MIMSDTYSLYDLLINQDVVQVPRLFVYFAVIETIIVFILYISLFDKMDYKCLKSKLPNIIKMAQRIENIKLNLETYCEKSEFNDYFDEEITAETELTYNQYIFLNYIKELEEIQKVWDDLRYYELIDHLIIDMPYSIAYNIRKILDMEIKDDHDDDGEKYVWLYKNEKACLKKYKKYDPDIKPQLENNDHVVICMQCKKDITAELLNRSRRNSYNLDREESPPISDDHVCDNNREIDFISEEENYSEEESYSEEKQALGKIKIN